MKLYTVLQEKYTEGNFDDLEAGHSIHHGVFSTREAAQKYIDGYSVIEVDTEYATCDQNLYIIENELNIPLVSDSWN